MGRRAQGEWIERAGEMAACRDAAARTAGRDPVAAVAESFGVTRVVARRLLAAYDAVAPHLERLAVTGSLGAIRAWQQLADIDREGAALIQDEVLTGALPLSAVKDVLDSARATKAASPEVMSMGIDDLIEIINARAGTLAWYPSSGIAESIPLDFDYRDVIEGTADDQPIFVPNRALLISPSILCSKSRSRRPATFAMSILAAAGMYRSVLVACASAVEEELLTSELAECSLRPGHVMMIVIGPRALDREKTKPE